MYGLGMVWAKVLMPILLVAAGGSAAVAATRQSSPAQSVSSADAVVWIDNPAAGSTFSPGAVGVDAHSVADSKISALVLYVDDKKVAEDDQLTVVQDLVYATFDWEATAGRHSIVVAQVGGQEARSEPRTVDIVDGAPDAPEPVVTTTIAASLTTVPGETTTVAESTTTAAPTDQTTTLPNAVPTTRPPSRPPTTRPPTTRPPTTIPPTTIPQSPPDIVSADVAFGYGGAVLYVLDCGYSAEVTAVVHGAKSVSVSVAGTNVNAPMTKSGNTYRYTLQSGSFSQASIGNNRQVIIAASNSADSVTMVAGRVDIERGCPKD